MTWAHPKRLQNLKHHARSHQGTLNRYKKNTEYTDLANTINKKKMKQIHAETVKTIEEEYGHSFILFPQDNKAKKKKKIFFPSKQKKILCSLTLDAECLDHSHHTTCDPLAYHTPCFHHLNLKSGDEQEDSSEKLGSI